VVVSVVFEPAEPALGFGVRVVITVALEELHRPSFFSLLGRFFPASTRAFSISALLGRLGRRVFAASCRANLAVSGAGQVICLLREIVLAASGLAITWAELWRSGGKSQGQSKILYPEFCAQQSTLDASWSGASWPA
jgi:hypothetical protein